MHTLVKSSLEDRPKTSFGSDQSHTSPTAVMKFLKVGRVAIISRGRYAGKKVVIIAPQDTGSKKHPFPHALVAGIERYPLQVTRRMSKARVTKRSKVKPFIKVINYNHLMPTRYTLELEGLKGAVTNETFTEVSQREEAKKTVKKALEERYVSGKNRWFFTPLRESLQLLNGTKGAGSDNVVNRVLDADGRHADEIVDRHIFADGAVKLSLQIRRALSHQKLVRLWDRRRTDRENAFLEQDVPNEAIEMLLKSGSLHDPFWHISPSYCLFLRLEWSVFNHPEIKYEGRDSPADIESMSMRSCAAIICTAVMTLLWCFTANPPNKRTHWQSLEDLCKAVDYLLNKVADEGSRNRRSITSSACV
nr:60s ribosomal protein l27-a [Quercus suber]